MNLVNQLRTMAYNAKEAAMGVGGQQVKPTMFANPMSGFYDPSDVNALYSQLSNARAQGEVAKILDGQVAGTNLANYRDQLNEGFQTVRYAVNPVMGKSASEEFYDEYGNFVDIDDLAAEEAYETGLFEEDKLPDASGWFNIQEKSASRTAERVDTILDAMYDTGVIYEIAPEYADYLDRY